MAYHGAVKSFNPVKGWGFIESEQTRQIYGKDMFVLASALPGGFANKGDEVSFSVVEEMNGPVATDVQFTRQHPHPVPSTAAAAGGAAMGALMQTAPARADGGGGRHAGTVKSFNAESGWGMIASPEMLQTYGKDIFFSKNAVQGGWPSTGQEVYFSIKMEAKGPAASSVVLRNSSGPGPGWQPGGKAAGGAWGKNGLAAGGGWGKGGGAAGGSWGMGSAGGSWGKGCEAAAGGWEKGGWGTPPGWGAKGGPARDQRFYGVLKAFNEEKGWGHIACDATSKVYGKDVFIMKGALQGQTVQQGALLSFKVTMGNKGPHASQVSVLPPGSFRISEEPSAVFSGQIKSFNVEKGWGFIASEELQATFSKDIFVHKRELNGQNPSVGEVLQFTVEIDDGGQPVARSTSGGSYGPAWQAQPAIRTSPY